MALKREPQREGSFEADSPYSGYYNELTGVAIEYGSADKAIGWLDLYENRREYVAPVSVIQLGLGAWQLAMQAGETEDGHSWHTVVNRVANWIVMDMDGYGRLPYFQDMPHTYALKAPWYSAMAQGQAASLLMRAAQVLDREELGVHAARAIESLVHHDSKLRVETDEGPVLQEYPTEQPAHVLNGWIFALWGLYDVARSKHVDEATQRTAQSEFDEGFAALERRLELYDVGRGWSRYDLYDHPIVHVCSPFYHRLHIAQLRAMAELRPSDVLSDTADRWEKALSRRATVASAVARKIGFRILRPRRRAAS